MNAKVFAVSTIVGLSGAALAGPVVINFDDLPAVSASVAGNYYAAQGVTMSQVTSSPDATLGAFLSLVSVSPNFLIWSGTGNVSNPNYAYAAGQNDMFFSFSTAITSLSVDLDVYPESPNVVRLAALVYNTTGPNAGLYEVIASVAAQDDPSTTVTLTVAPGQSFVHAIFQSTDEQEGFDNLTFSVVPLPSGAALAGFGLLGLGLASRRRKA